MSIRTSKWQAGMPCWVDLVTPDIKAAQSFYSAVLGWQYAETGQEYGGYVMAQVNGHAAGGIGPLPEPASVSAWTLYLASDDADKTAQSVTDNGGTVVLPPGEVGPLGRMFIATEPSGAAFGVWQAKGHIGAEVVNEPGSLVWEDLRSQDPDASRAFYNSLFGYRQDALEMAGPDYTTFALPSEDWPLGGMGGMMGMDGLPSHWISYFAVSDTDAAVAEAESGGGSVMAPAFDSPFGRMAGLSDMAGAPFFVIEANAAQTPDRSR